MKKKVGILSDLHLESSNMELGHLDCDILVLAGDISQDFSLLWNFFSYQIPPYIQIIYVPGNHEYEGKRLNEVIEKLKEFEEEFPNLHVLQNEAIDIEGIRFIGSTLWSNFEGSGVSWKDEIKKWCKFSVVDFTYIFKKNPNGSLVQYTSWTPDDMETEFEKAYQFLEYELKRNPTENPKFVVTHFAPHQNSVSEKYKGNVNNAYWVNQLPELMGFCDYWAHGHTHTTFRYTVEGTEVICNPRGYSKMFNLSQNLKFDKNLYVEVEVPTKENKIKM